LKRNSAVFEIAKEDEKMLNWMRCRQTDNRMTKNNDNEHEQQTTTTNNEQQEEAHYSQIAL